MFRFSTSSIFKAAAVLAALLTAYSCQKDDPDPVVPKKDETRKILVVQGYSTNYVNYAYDAGYEKASKNDGLTLRTSVTVMDPTSSVEVSWYRINSDGKDILVRTDKMDPSSTEKSYTTSLSLTKEQFNEYFPQKKYREEQFYCKFSLFSKTPEIKSVEYLTDTMTIATALPEELMVLRINTVNGEEPTCDYVSPPPGNNGAGIRNCTKVPGRLKISLGGRQLYDSGEYVQDQSGMTLKIRGNTSAYAAQKPYKIKLQKKRDLLFRGNEDKYKDKEWVLIRGNANLNTFIGLETCRFLGFEWVPAMQYVNVVVNDDYRGLYCLVESYKRNEDCRARITEKGFLIEKDAYWWNEDLYFDTNGFPSNMKFTFKYPDPEEIQADQLLYIQAYVNKAEEAIHKGKYEEYLDVPTFARWLLYHDIYASLDCAGSNLYLIKKDMTSSTKLEMLSPWDFDSMYWNGSFTQCWSNQHVYDAFYYPTLLNSGNHTFRDQYKSEWQNVRNRIHDYMDADVRNLISEKGDAINTSRKLNQTRWGGGYTSVTQDYTNMNRWLDERIGWLDREIGRL